tara:strand:- start:415 stop:552 length:138 start_codon:yes stop_codon:yes gene_type:complete
MGEKMKIWDLQMLIYVVLWFLIFIALCVGNYNELTRQQKRDKELE